MFGPWIWMWQWLRGRRAGSPIKRPHVNFITLHYAYIISWTLIGSIILYPSGIGMRYIDALFFGASAATTSGLNTIDVNLLKTYQQATLYLIPMLTNPIVINTFLVFVRLYWFERRFQNVVKEARLNRRTRSRSKTEARDEKDLGHAERGVNGRNIVVLHHGQGSSSPAPVHAEPEKETAASLPGAGVAAHDHAANEAGSDTRAAPTSPAGPAAHREITFADGWTGADPHVLANRLPAARSTEHHIAFLENQRNPKDKDTLRIPGPRDFDRGVKPEAVKEDGAAGPPTEELASMREPSHDRPNDEGSESTLDDQPVKRTITIDESARPRPSLHADGSPATKMRRAGSLRAPSLGKTAPSFGKAISAARTRASTWMDARQGQPKESMPYLSWTPTIGRNSAFIDLTEEQREELGGIEYRALKTLAVILVSYFVFFHIFGMICLLPWIHKSGRYGPIVEGYGISRTWWGFFTPATLFNDLGFTLTPDSMISFNRAVFPLLLGSFLIIIGNAGFPCMLRFVIWVCSRLVPRDSSVWEELKFLLDHPRRCFTLLFPSKATWWLFWILVIFNVVDVFFFVMLDLNHPVVSNLPVGIRLLDGLFQAASTRTAGTSIVNLAELHPATQVSYMVMMYISVFPIAISVRNTNVYEEKSLGIYGTMEDRVDDYSKPTYFSAHFRRQLTFDLWYVFLGLFVVAIVEGRRIENTNDYIVSAYGNVGLSLGYPGINTSFSGTFSTLSKLVIVAMQIRGRHRGLPYAVDRAILLPSEALQQKEEEDARNRMLRRNSILSAVSARPQDSARLLASTTPVTSPPALTKAASIKAPSAKDGKEGRTD